jgi:hypothetical protein
VRGERYRLHPRLDPTSTLKRYVGGLEASTLARFKADPTGEKVRRFKEFHDVAGSWSRVRRIVARGEAGSEGTNTRFIVTNLGYGSGPFPKFARMLYRLGMPSGVIRQT